MSVNFDVYRPCGRCLTSRQESFAFRVQREIEAMQTNLNGTGTQPSNSVCDAGLVMRAHEAHSEIERDGCWLAVSWIQANSARSGHTLKPANSTCINLVPKKQVFR